MTSPGVLREGHDSFNHHKELGLRGGTAEHCAGGGLGVLCGEPLAFTLFTVNPSALNLLSHFDIPFGALELAHGYFMYLSIVV